MIKWVDTMLLSHFKWTVAKLRFSNSKDGSLKQDNYSKQINGLSSLVLMSFKDALVDQIIRPNLEYNHLKTSKNGNKV